MTYKLQTQALIVAEFRQLFADDEEFVVAVQLGTTFNECATMLLEHINHDLDMANAAKQRAKDLQERAKRFELRAQSRRDGLHRAMNLAGVHKLELPEATISIGAKAKSVVITDESLLPKQCWRVKEEVDKTEVKKLLQLGGCAGAEWSNGGESLTIRSK